MIPTESGSNAAADDLLIAATAALANAPILPGPAEAAIQCAATLPSRSRAGRSWPRFALAACLLLATAGALFMLPRNPTSLAFADVVRAVAQTHTVTGDFNLSTPLGPMQIRLLIKDQNLRLETKLFIVVANAAAGKCLLLQPLLKQAQAGPFGDPGLNLYNLFRNYKGGQAKSLGEKQINGRRAVGFQITRPQGELDGGDWIFWVDPTTDLPVEAGTPDQMIRNLHFDVPLDDSLFSTALPPGYAWADVNASLGGPTTLFAGQVVDQRGKPIAGAKVIVRQQVRKTGGYTGQEAGQTDRDGRFTAHVALINDNDNNSALTSSLRFDFEQTSFLPSRIEQVQRLTADQRTHLKITMEDGASLAGAVVDDAGHPVADAAVEATVAAPHDRDIQAFYRKTTQSDSAGRFSFHGLPPRAITLHAHMLAPPAPARIGYATVDLASPPPPLTIRLKPLSLPPGNAVHQLFGMKLIDITPAVADQLSPLVRSGVLVLDAGPQSPRLGEETVRQFDVLGEVGSVPVTGFDDLVSRLLAVCNDEEQGGQNAFSVMVVDFHADLGSNTNFLHLTAQNLDELRRAAAH